MASSSSSSSSLRSMTSLSSRMNRVSLITLSNSSRMNSRFLSSMSQVSITPSNSSVPPPSLSSSSPFKPSRKARRNQAKVQRKASQKAIAQDSLSARLGVSTKTTSPYVRLDRQFKTFKPLTPSLRWVRHALVPHLHKGAPEKALTIAKRATGGRNSHGHITVRGRGGGHKRRIRLIDFKRLEAGEQEVLRIEYDPGRSAHIALIQHKETKLKSYILATEGLRAGDSVQSFREMGKTSSGGGVGGNSSLDLGIFRTKAIRPGNVLPLNLIPIGTTICGLSLKPDGPAKLLRSAGASGQLVSFSARTRAAGIAALAAQDADIQANENLVLEGSKAQEEVSETTSPLHTHAQIRLQSGEVRLLLAGCSATIGKVSNGDHEHERMGKAGRRRWLGWKPKVRGVAMNA